LQHLTLMGCNSLSGGVLDALIKHRVETVLLSVTGRYRARLMVDEHKHVERRRAQYLCLSDPVRALVAAKALVRGKLANSARFLALRGMQHENSELATAAARIRGLADSLEPLSNMDLVRGAEGHAANLYFQVFPLLLRNPGFTFNGRTRRPPLDPVNALLSFVYTLLTQEVLTQIKTVGLDPYLGALHAVDYGRPSLACDLVEEWRSFLGDRLVLTLINRQAVGPKDFIIRGQAGTGAVDETDLKAKRPVEMKPGTLRALLQSYEKWMSTPIKHPETGERVDHRGLVRRQVKYFDDYLSGKVDRYDPFLWSRIF
jgi:CRISP-associated protein Cas1